MHEGHYSDCRKSIVNYSCLSVSGIVNDGFSRLVTYLHCSNNNCASTVLALFFEACRMCSIPSRVHCDHDIENVDVARWMHETRGLNHHWKLHLQSTDR